MALTAAIMLSSGVLKAQSTKSDTTSTDANKPGDDIITLTPFEVSSEKEEGYSAATTLAGNRLNTELRDVGNAVTVVTSQFLKDVGATDNSTLLQYTPGTEVGNIQGNFAGTGNGATLDESTHFTNPNNNTRIRGLTAADNTRDFYLSDVPWDSFDIDGVDLQRGPNSILFGQGSPAGIINSRLKLARFTDSNEVTARVGDNGSQRFSFDFNHVLVKDQLALRVASVYDDEQYNQDPAYNLSRRLYGALRFEPAFLKKGGARTVFKANMEVGKVTSNNPRELPPIDLITPWFKTGTYTGADLSGNPVTYPNLNRTTYLPDQNEDDNTGLAGHGENRPAHNGPSEISGNPNQYYQPEIGNYAAQFGNPTAAFNSNSSVAQGAYINWEPTSNHGIGSDGKVDGNLSIPFQRPVGIAPYPQYAQNAHLIYSNLGVYHDMSLTDPSIFDFYHQLLDGPNKHEWQNWRVYNLSLEQTFFDDQVGFELAYNKEFYKNGQVSLLSGENQAIGIDFNSFLPDNGQGNSTTTSTAPANPNVGRAYVSDNGQNGNNSYRSDRETKRATVFARHDFSKDGDNWFFKFLGYHTITGLYDKYEQDTENRSWQRYGVDTAYETFINNATDTPKLVFTSNQLTPNTVIYLGPSLASRSSASGADLPNPTAVQTIVSGTVRNFDSTWNKPTNPSDPNYVNPAAYWHNDYYPVNDPITGLPSTTGDSTQSENPANYVGFRNVPITVIDSETSQANRDLLTTNARLTKDTLKSTAFTWQGKFWDDAVVGTFGMRKDTASSWAFSENTTGNSDSGASAAIKATHLATDDAYGHLNLNPSTYHLDSDPSNTLNVKSHAWSVVAHLNDFPGLKKFKDSLPFQFSVYYNHSTDFQPAPQRVDIYGTPLAAPEGVTKDRGILIEGKDGRWSLKINKYETVSTNADSSAVNYTWFIGASQAWAANWVNRFQYDWIQDSNAGAVANPDPTNSEYNYGQGPNQTLAQAQAEEQAAITAWRAWQKSVDPRFYTAWGINLNDPTKGVTSTQPNGLSITEDSKSKGYEIELSAMPTKNWRLTLNGSKTTAVRYNVGGTALSDFVAKYGNALKTTALGDLRIWWGGAGNETTLQEWTSGNQPFGSAFAQVKEQEGANVPELRQWRWNGITNYDFDHGMLKGVNVGGGIRYESGITLGYPILAATQTLDLANPYRGAADTNVDVWVGYTRKIWKKLEWNIQLNVRNLGVHDELMPLTTQPDGTVAQWRIRPPQTWTLTNTFRF